ncbi:MAG: DUF853 family protein [Sarcina sp.]|nr:DUF853 family protein [Sarcina sp.]
MGEVSFNPSDLVRKGQEGKGMINVLECNQLVQERIFYSTIFLWVVSEISERMPDTYDLDLPAIVFIIDEAR